MRRLAGVLAVLGALVMAAPAGAADVPAGYTYTDQWFTSFDGTKLHAGVFLPANHQPGEQHPTLMVMTPYAGPNGGVNGQFTNPTGIPSYYPQVFDRRLRSGRWAVVQVDVRGFGGSGGCYEYYGPNEARDVKVAVDWAGSQDWSTGKVGMWGVSYDGAQQVLALASKPEHLAAAVIGSPGLSAYTALWLNGVHYATQRYATGPIYTADDLAPQLNADSATSEGYADAFASGATQGPGCRTDSVVKFNTISDRSDPFWAGREPYLGAQGSDVPVLWSQGFYDLNTKPVFLPIWKSLTGPHWAWFGQFVHEGGWSVGREGYMDQAVRFLNRFVRGVDSGVVDPAVTIQEGDGTWRFEDQWPPADAQPWAMPVHAGSYQDLPGNTAGGDSAGHGTWTFTQPLPGDAHLAGEAELSVPVTTTADGVHVVAHLYDVDAQRKAVFVNRGAFNVPKAGTTEVRFKLLPQDWRFPAGHRIALLLSGADDDFFAPSLTRSSVEVAAGSLTLPLLSLARTSSISGGPSDGMDDNEPFTVTQETIDAATVEGAPPPQQSAG
jgi:predicted acyl esterase